MNRTRIALIGILLAVLAIPALARETGFSADIANMAAGADNGDRRERIVSILETMGLAPSLQEFEATSYRGTEEKGANIVVSLPGGEARPRILLTAHYDRVKEGAGAIDNASGCAAVLWLLRELQTKALNHYAVTAVFFDLEEKGLLGSKHWVKTHAESLPAIAVNFDVFGYGDTLWVMCPDQEKVSGQSIKNAAAAAEFNLQIGPKQPPSDYVPFVRANVETLSISLIGAEEIPPLLDMLEKQVIPESPPRIFQLIHTASDTMAHVDGAAGKKALPVIAQALRLMDAAAE